MALELDGGAVVYQMRAKEPYYLLLKSATSGFWGFPKGHLENTESALEAAERDYRHGRRSFLRRFKLSSWRK